MPYTVARASLWSRISSAPLPLALTIISVPVTARFSRLRDTTLRLRLVATATELEDLAGICTLIKSQRFGEDFYTGRITIEAPAIESFITTLSSLGGPWPQFANDLSTNYQRLLPAPPARKAALGSTPVLDDAALRKLVRARPAPPRSLVIDELGIQGAFVRADVATLSADMWTGVELKGHTDSLTRLPRQVLAYSAVFDLCELVTTPKHLDKAHALLPSWWGLSVATTPSTIEHVRPSLLNPSPDDFSRCQLLWRDEAMEILRNNAAAKGLSNSARFYVFQRLAGVLQGDALRTAVFAALETRTGWLRDSGKSRAPF